ncbi:hypothetical protein A9Q83_06590 [Alphaproteobacteria bacterium 46_93_T64]|nr:hypothetical protein A9Q83_06590 [Alphaproteobacteria bacterium 46_93_T64]
MTRVGFVVSFLLLSSTVALADFQAGMTAYNNRDFGKAISIWEADGARGDFNAQFNLGTLYEQGVADVPKDLSKAYAWYRLAAAQNVAAATTAIARLKPLLTAGQIEDGNKLAIGVLGKWYRQNIGQDEQEYQKILASREAKQKARVDAEKRASSERAKRQRTLIAQRDADAKMAKKIEQASRAAALQASREQAEEAKRNAYLAGKQREEEERLAALKAENEKQGQILTAKQRLAELKAKQQGGSNTAVIVAAKPASGSAVNTASTNSISKPAAQNVSTAPQKAVSAKIVAPKIVTPKTVAPKTVATKTATPTKTKLPIVSNGMDAEVVGQIMKQASAVSVDTAAAKAEIESGRTDIEALKWSLISAARGKGGAKKMNVILVKSMTSAQITEANRRAAKWISKRQKRG